MSTNKAKISLLWSAVEQFGSQGCALIITIVISRIVTPKDYGIIAMLTIFMALSQVFINGGLSNYLIQKKDREDIDFNTVFYLNVGVGLFCYLAMVFSSQAIANFYHQPILNEIIKVYFLSLIISSLTIVQRAIIYISYQYKKLSIITLISIIIAGSSAIVLAVNNYGVWALVFYNLIDAFCSSVLIWITTTWHPRIRFSFAIAKKAFSFGSKLLGANLLGSSVSNLYTLVIGKKFQATDLGFYSRGQSLAVVFPSNFSNMLQKATYPVLCDLQDDNEGLKAIFSKYLRIAAMVTIPLMMFLYCVAEPLVKVILSEKWLAAVPFLQILCIGSMLDPIMRLNSIILSVTGKTKYSLYSEILKKSTLLILLFSTLQFGLKWVTIGAAVYSIFDLIIVSFFVKKIIPFSLIDEVKIISPYLLISLTCSVFTFVVNRFINLDILQIILSIAVFFISYGILVKLFMPRQFKEVLSWINFMRSKNG